MNEPSEPIDATPVNPAGSAGPCFAGECHATGHGDKEVWFVGTDGSVFAGVRVVFRDQEHAKAAYFRADDYRITIEAIR